MKHVINDESSYNFKVYKSKLKTDKLDLIAYFYLYEKDTIES